MLLLSRLVFLAAPVSFALPHRHLPSPIAAAIVLLSRHEPYRLVSLAYRWWTARLDHFLQQHFVSNLKCKLDEA